MKIFMVRVFLMFTAYLIPPLLIAQQSKITIKATGTGQTTGHIANISVTNRNDYPVTVIHQIFYIASDGRYQSYIAWIAGGITIPPNSTIILPASGYCANVHKPPVALDSTMNIEKWVPVEPTSPSIGPPGQSVRIVDRENVPPFSPAAIPAITRSPSFKARENQNSNLSITWPGTEIPVGGTLEQDLDPEITAPILVSVLRQIDSATTTIQKSGKFPTPFTPDSLKERESIIQQTFWIYNATLSGHPYTKEDFEKNVYKQYEQAVGKPVTSLAPGQKEKIEEGVAAFWTVFTATGVEAKVLKVPGESPPVEISNKEKGCTGDTSLHINPPFKLDMRIAEQWGTPGERQKTIQEVQNALSKHVQLTPGEVFSEYDINRHPTSASSFWKAGNVGGFASAFAKTYFKRADGTWDWVWGTEKLETRAEGAMEYSLSYVPDEDCRAMVAGSALIRIRASSSAFDAMASNTQLDNNTKHLNFLRTTKYFGKKAAEWLILKARGRAKSSFNNFIQDDLKEKIKEGITDAMMAEAQKLAEQHLNGLLGDMGLTLEQIMNTGFELPSLEGLLEDLMGIDIPSVDDLTEFISKGIEATFNLPFVSNTYARANGNLVVKVGGKTGSVLAGTSVHYARQAAEETKDALRWSGEDCKEAFVSDAQANALTIHTSGYSNLVAEAASKFGFGNGKAEAFLESMNLQVLAGICICPPIRADPHLTYELNVHGTLEWYTANKEHQTALKSSLNSLLDQVNDQMVVELNRLDKQALINLTNDQFEKMLADKVRAWGKVNKFAWGACKE